ncbi:hypothetical protein [Jannaschia donghaensis]|uniref:Uncharacterized protein n=1 Tax=Jannaschia donghaensis TaxID=420998 RepID=A0A0M6YLI8_9RHOB|nr:hypothetical protein [Jannaschia donghaensis]CTQ51221.1 hypothetical protein JDO7802_03260 [Jannaschia donghaensis]
MTLTEIAPLATEQIYAAQKVTDHVDGPSGHGDCRYLSTLRKAQNHVNALGVDTVDLVVVMHGNGLGMLQNAVGNDDLKTGIAWLKG